MLITVTKLILKQTHWNIPNDDYKAQVLKVCNQQWRTYKSKLHKFLDRGLDPLKKYPYLEEEIWKDFKKKKSTAEFKVCWTQLYLMIFLFLLRSIYVVMFAILLLIYEGNKSESNSKCEDEQESAQVGTTRVSWLETSMGRRDGIRSTDKSPSNIKRPCKRIYICSVKTRFLRGLDCNT